MQDHREQCKMSVPEKKKLGVVNLNGKRNEPHDSGSQ